MTKRRYCPSAEDYFLKMFYVFTSYYFCGKNESDFAESNIRLEFV